MLVIGDNITPESTIGERALTGLQVMLIGMSVVFGVLILLMCILYIFKLVSLRSSKKNTAESKEPAPAVVPAADKADDEELTVAVITAAIAAARGESECAFNIKSIKKIVK